MHRTALRTLWRKMCTLARYLWPTVKDRAYLKIIRDSEQFDRTFYLLSNPGLRRVFHLWPERHYVQLGEAQGCCPNDRFSPRAYKFHHPELLDEEAPFLHYLTSKDQRQTDQPILSPSLKMPEIRTYEHVSSAPQAVVVHLYYLDLWPELAHALDRQSVALDLIVTLTDGPGATELAHKIRESYEGARVWCLPNHGRDIWPFVWLVNNGVLAPYRAVAKLHSKRSPHLQNGDQWRSQLFHKILEDPELQKNIDRFCSDEAAALWTHRQHIMVGDKWWGCNRERAVDLATRINLDLPSPLQFGAGTMFWIKPRVLQRLGELALEMQDFEPEEARVDGTTAHAVERLIGSLVTASGLKIVSDP
jgi:lipopolysaccharide biosynthesis protein